MNGLPPEPPPMRQLKEPCAPLAWLPLILAVTILIAALIELS